MGSDQRGGAGLHARKTPAVDRGGVPTSFALPNDTEFSGEPQSCKKRDDGTRVRCNELLGALWLAERKPECRERDGQAER